MASKSLFCSSLHICFYHMKLLFWLCSESFFSTHRFKNKSCVRTTYIVRPTKIANVFSSRFCTYLVELKWPKRQQKQQLLTKFLGEPFFVGESSLRKNLIFSIQLGSEARGESKRLTIQRMSLIRTETSNVLLAMMRQLSH